MCSHEKHLIVFNCESEYDIIQRVMSSYSITSNNVIYENSDKACLKKIEDEINEQCKKGTVVFLFSYYNMQKELEDFFRNLTDRAIKIAVGSDAIMLNVSNISTNINANINRYFYYGGEENITNVAHYIVSEFFGFKNSEIPPAKPLPFDGIFSPINGKVYENIDNYFADSNVYPHYVGYILHRSCWIKNNYDEVKSAAKYLAKHNIGIIPVFSSGNIDSPDFSELVDLYFRTDGQLVIDGIINASIFLIKAKNGKTAFEQSVIEYQKLDLPVFNAINCYYITVKQWKKLKSPLTSDMPGALISPEATGMIEPVVVTAKSEDGRRNEVIEHQMEYLCGRVAKWIALRYTKNSEKKITIMLHNSVCSGVEATIGKAYGLDSFESAVNIMKRLKREGYTVRNIPENGRALLNLIQERKAISDFRWTAVEDIVECGGCIYKMDTDSEYMQYFSELPEHLRQYMIDTWGEAPGEGMVLGRSIIISGIDFGNVQIMVQPKRGCYGAKCTGEVCRILHDPVCPPPHQYVATYKYIEHIFGANACIDVGTDGSLEMLPGKTAGLSSECWTHIVQGSTPLIYVYNSGVPSEGMIAKRRANALLITHLPPAKRGIDRNTAEIVRKSDEYFNAKLMNNGQDKDIATSIKARLEENAKCKKIVESAETFDEGLRLLSDAANKSLTSGTLSTKHVFGINPDKEERYSFIKEIWKSEEIRDFDDVFLEDRAYSQVLVNKEKGLDGIKEQDAREIEEKLKKCGNEMDSLVKALEGKYIIPGQSGMPDKNGRNIIPTGRNMHASDIGRVPTPLAYERGVRLAKELLESYMKDEGRLPYKIAMNMISLDVTRTDGEQLSEFLYLLGVRPTWDKRGQFHHLEIIPLKELGRPRIDVTVRISGVLRDTWPFAVNIMDDAVMKVALLDESSNDNYIVKNIKEYEKTFSESEESEKTARIFGDAPGAYGSGIELALLASAWEAEEDLAKYFIQASSFSYGNKRNGKKSIKEFIENMRKADLSTDITQCDRMNTINCCFGLQVQGGFNVLSKTLGNGKLKQYQSLSDGGKTLKTKTLKDVVLDDVNNSLLNDLWRENIKEQGYEGAHEIMHLIQNIFGVQCTSHLLEDNVVDQIVDTYINNEDMRQWITENNSYAVEEIARRMLELYQRGRWDPSDETLQKLRENYLQIEGDIEEGLESLGDIQGGNVEIINDNQVSRWKEALAEIEKEMRIEK